MAETEPHSDVSECGGLRLPDSGMSKQDTRPDPEATTVVSIGSTNTNDKTVFLVWRSLRARDESAKNSTETHLMLLVGQAVRVLRLQVQNHVQRIFIVRNHH